MTHRALFEACENGDLATVQHLVDHGLDPSFSHSVALRLAAQHNHLSIVKYLLPYSDPTANHSDALMFAVTNNNPQMIDLLWEVCDPLATDPGYISTFYVLNILGAWERVWDFANGPDGEKIKTKMWISSLLMHNQMLHPTVDPLQQKITDMVCERASDLDIIEGFKFVIYNKDILNDRFCNKLISCVNDPEGLILSAAISAECGHTIGLLINHPSYAQFFPTISKISLDAAMLYLIKGSHALNVMRLMPHTNTMLNDQTIKTLIYTGNIDLWDILVSEKVFINPDYPQGVSWVLGSVCHHAPDMVIKICQKTPQLDVVPIAARMAALQNEDDMRYLISRCPEFDLLTWMSEQVCEEKHVSYVKDLYAKIQKEVLVANLPSTDVQAHCKRM